MKRLLFVFAILLSLMASLQAAEPGDGAVPAQGMPKVVHAGQLDSPDSVEQATNVIVHGVYLPPIANYGTELLAFNDLVGKDVGILNYFVGWYPAPHDNWWLPYQISQQVPQERWPQIMISWLPIGRDCRTMPPDQAGDWSVNTSLYDIADGYCDDYVRLVAQEFKSLPFTFMIRFAHEMNLLNQPWWVGHYNSDPQLYIDAYRRIYDLFLAEGVTNVQWVWSPNYASNPREEWNSLFNYYPGDEYVDWVGLAAYNWAEWLNAPWWSLTDLLDSDTWDHVVPELSCRYAKPIIVELASVDGTRVGDGTKEGWVQDGYQQLDQYPFVKAVAWFNDFDYSDPNRADFRVVGGSYFDPDPAHEGYAYPVPENDGRWTQGYIAAVAREKFIDYVPALADITPPGTYCGGEPAIKVPSIIYALPGETRSLIISVIGLIDDGDLSLVGLPTEVTADFGQQTLYAPWDDVQLELNVTPDAQLGSFALTLTVDIGTDIYEESMMLTITDEIHRVYLPMIRK